MLQNTGSVCAMRASLVRDVLETSLLFVEISVSRVCVILFMGALFIQTHYSVKIDFFQDF